MTPHEHLDQPAAPAKDRGAEGAQRRRGGWLLGLGVLFVLFTAFAFGAEGHYSRDRQVAATAEQLREFVPQVHVATVKSSDDIAKVSLPATTTAYQAVDLFARVSGYIEKREVDIGDHVKKGQLLAKIAVPETDDQVQQAEATLGQLQAALKQAQANEDLAQVTWDRDQPLVKDGWDTKQQGTIDSQALKEQEAAVGVAQANVNAEQQQLRVLHQQQDYQQPQDRQDETER